MSKVAKYTQLVHLRKQFEFSNGLLNPAQIESGIYDQTHLGAWSDWQGNLDAKILLIGQDWGDITYFLKNKGSDCDENPTNRTLMELFQILGIEIGSPSQPNPTAPTFFTNAILGIKEKGGLAGKVLPSWARESTKAFLIPLLEIINPEIIITLGTVAYNEIAFVYSLPRMPLKKLVQENPMLLKDNKRLYARYHCGRLGLANRKLALQKQDWEMIAL
jgi:DNA polymerase